MKRKPKILTQITEKEAEQFVKVGLARYCSSEDCEKSFLIFERTGRVYLKGEDNSYLLPDSRLSEYVLKTILPELIE